MEYSWLLLVWIIYIIVLVMYALLSGVIRDLGGEKTSPSADIMFFGVTSVLVLNATSIINSESALKRPR